MGFRAPNPCKGPNSSSLYSGRHHLLMEAGLLETHFFLCPQAWYSDSFLISVAPRNQSQARSSSPHKCLTAQCDSAPSTPRGL